MTMRTSIGVCTLLCAALVCGDAEAQARKVRMFLEPLPAPTSAFVDAESQRAIDSHQDVLNAVKGQSEWQVVESRELADVVLTLTGAGREDIGRTSTTTTGIFAPVNSSNTTTEKVEAPTVHLMLTAGDYTRTFSAFQPAWKAAAKVVVLDVRKWTRENRAQLLVKP